MGKLPGSYMNANPNPNPKKKQKRFHNDMGSVTQTALEDAFSYNQRGNGANGFNFGSYMSFNIASYSKIDIGELRRRLVSELELIRSVRDRIDSGQFSSTINGGIQNSNSRGVRGGKNSKKLGENGKVGLSGMENMEGLMKECRQILTKLMKHKDGWVFNVPVDDVALGLHDYHQIVKRPMDLGTVKSNFAKKLYVSPVEFAEDVRLTFNNALLYNPSHDPVHGMAEELLARFEEFFKPIQEKIDRFRAVFEGEGKGGDVKCGSWNHIPTPERIKKPKSVPVAPPVVASAPPLAQMSVQSRDSTPSHPPPPSVDPLPATAVESLTAGRTKLPKPRAKDPDKREMSMEEKHKLGVGLQSLPQEKMPQLVQIIRKRNDQLAQDGDEIELDIEALDTETLWELDRFVTNWKKMVSKTKRQALLMNLNPGNAAAPSTSAAETDVGGTVSEKNDYEKPKKGEDLDEDDVDIEDDMPVTSFPPVEIEKDEAGGGGEVDRGGGHGENGNAGSDSSSSSSSGSDSSSSSDSDSGSSSGSDSDEEEAQS